MAQQVNVYRTGRLKDKTIFKLLKAIEEGFGSQTFVTNIGTLSVDYTIPENEEQLSKANSTSITAAHITTSKSKFTVYFRRGISTDANNFNSRQPSAYFDEIIVALGVNNQRIVAPTLEEVFACEKIIKKYITNVVPESVESEANSATSLLQAQISSLSDQYLEMITGLDKRRSQLDEEHDKKLADLEVIRQEKLEELEEKQKENDGFNKLVELDLEKKEQTLDNRHHMHARRRLRENINEDVKARLSETIVPKSAHIMRWGVFLMAVCAAGFLGFIAYTSIVVFSGLNVGLIENAEDVATSSTVHISGWFLLLKAFLSSAGAIGAFSYAISWLQRLYLDDVRMVRELERYAYDINRASWAIETIMEMQNKGGVEPPKAWISAVCDNLFSDHPPHKEKDTSTPLEALLNSSANVELSPDGAKFELNGKGAKKLAKDIIK